MNVWVILGATLIGWSLQRILSQRTNALKLLLAFSGAFVFAVIFLHLAPEMYEEGPSAGLWILVGFVIQQGLETFSRGLEHGHAHAGHSFWPAVISLFLHAFLEAMPLGMDHQNHHLESTLAGAIAIHKIPVAVVYFTFLQKANVSKWAYLMAGVLFLMAPVLGVELPSLVHIPAEAVIPLTGIAGGILLHISTTILYESSANHQFNQKKALITLLGLTLAALTLWVG